jgi:hypothetical protein
MQWRDSLARSQSPVPDKLTVCGLPGALSVTLRVPVEVPSTVGVNVRLTLQVLPAANVAPQVVAEIANGPLTLNPLKSSVAVAVFTFLMTTFFTLLTVSSFVVLKLSGEGVNVGASNTLEDQLKMVPQPGLLQVEPPKVAVE